MTQPTLARQRWGGRTYPHPPYAGPDEAQQDWPSMTAVLGAFDRPGINFWTQASLVTASVELTREGVLAALDDKQAATLIKDRAKSNRFARTGIGSDVHTLAEARIKNEPQPAVDPQALLYQPAIDAFLDAHTVEPLYVETTVYNTKLRYAGTADLWAIVDGEPCVLDWKSVGIDKSPALYPDVALQLTGLAMCDELADEATQTVKPVPPVTCGIAVALATKGRHKAVRIDVTSDVTRRTVQAARTAYAWLHEGRGQSAVAITI